jgi:hypothetical protein
MRKATSLFAVASHRPINLDAIKSALRMEPLLIEEAEKIALIVTEIVKTMVVGKSYIAKIRLHNGSNRLLCSRFPYPFHLSYHWVDESTGATIIYDGFRTVLMQPCRQNIEQNYEVVIRAPEKEGRYLLKVLSVQEMRGWHESSNQEEILVDVVVH